MAMTKKLGQEIAQRFHAYEGAKHARCAALEQMGKTAGAAWERASDSYVYWDSQVQLTRQALINMGIPMVGVRG